ncbi:MAG: hypothetical protein MUQ00_14655 [Candidatus Aminicenantes bacterium]|nr:hypothetical protein [Candidatus Aminicenantes bacterium]
MPPKRQELLNWFRRNAEPLAEAYEGAIRLLDDGNFPGRVHFIAHAVRDIADRLVFVLDPQLKGRRVQYEGEMDRIAKLWRALQTVRGTTNQSPTQDTVTINYRLAVMIDSLVTEHRERRGRPSSSELLFRFLMRKEPSEVEVNQRLVFDFKKVRKWFMRLTHFRDKITPEVDKTELQTQFSNFEGMLHSFVGDFFTGTRELDDIIQQANQ